MYLRLDQVYVAQASLEFSTHPFSGLGLQTYATMPGLFAPFFFFLNYFFRGFSSYSLIYNIKMSKSGTLGWKEIISRAQRPEFDAQNQKLG